MKMASSEWVHRTAGFRNQLLMPSPCIGQDGSPPSSTHFVRNTEPSKTTLRTKLDYPMKTLKKSARASWFPELSRDDSAHRSFKVECVYGIHM